VVGAEVVGAEVAAGDEQAASKRIIASARISAVYFFILFMIFPPFICKATKVAFASCFSSLRSRLCRVVHLSLNIASFPFNFIAIPIFERSNLHFLV
jgi:hypothetical protein